MQEKQEGPLGAFRLRKVDINLPDITFHRRNHGGIAKPLEQEKAQAYRHVNDEQPRQHIIWIGGHGKQRAAGNAKCAN